MPSAGPLDFGLLEAASAMARLLGFAWYSEHLGVLTTPSTAVENTLVGMGLPVAYDAETFALISEKLPHVVKATGCDVLLENPAVFTQIADMDMSEPAFFNKLHRETNCGLLLDLHNLYVSYRNGGLEPRRYLRELDPDSVREVHLAGGSDLHGYYTDSHARTTPEEVWALADVCIGRFQGIRALVFEFHVSYMAAIGVRPIVAELERMHELAAQLSSSREQIACF
jgi:uncharacterized protein (UPF0276 family)